MELMVKAMKAKVGNPLRKLVLIKLADNANDDGECWPSYQHIADQCEIGRSTVKNHIRELEKMGFVVRIFRRDGEINKSNIYRLNLDAAGGAESDRVGQELTEGGAGDARGGGAGADPRTSHSFESVKEPTSASGESAETPPVDDKPKKPKSVPYEAIVDLYHEILPELPQVVRLTDKRKAYLKARWQGSELAQDLNWWRDFFLRVRGSDFLMGRKKDWRANFEFLITESKFIGVLEGQYDNRS